jgi:hypothetical protein
VRAFDQGEPPAVQRQHPPVGSGQPIAGFGLGKSKPGFAGNAGPDFGKLSSLQRLQQIAGIDRPSLLLAGEALFE